MEEASVRFAMVDINEILKTLPHRYPMLLIDRVINIRTDYSGIGIKNVTFNERAFPRPAGLSRCHDDRGDGADRRRDRNQVGRGH